MKALRWIALSLAVLLLLTSAGCRNQQPAKQKLVIASPIGLAKLLPTILVKKRLIQERYKGEIEVEQRAIPFGTVINEGVVAGEIDVAVLSSTHAMLGVIKGVPYRICSAYSNHAYSLCVLDERFQGLEDFAPGDRIALPSLGGNTHLKLCRLVEQRLGSPSALNPMLIEMSAADAVQALMTGGVSATFLPFPHNYAQQAQPGVRVLYESVGEEPITELVAVATLDLHDKYPALYDAVVQAVHDAIDYIRDNPDEVASMLAEEYKLDPAVMRECLGALSFHTVPVGLEDMLDMMLELELLGDAPEKLPELCFEGVTEAKP